MRLALDRLPDVVALPEVAKRIEEHFLETEKDNVMTLFTLSGFNFSGSGQNAGMAFVAGLLLSSLLRR